jgi:hypothetical protein
MVFYFGWWALTFHEPSPIRGNIWFGYNKVKISQDLDHL